MFERLIEWAAAALEMSSNNPILPSALLVLNASELNIPAEQWDVKTSTENILESLSQTVHRNVQFMKYAKHWRDRHRNIETLEQLLLSYYSSIKVTSWNTE